MTSENNQQEQTNFAIQQAEARNLCKAIQGEFKAFDDNIQTIITLSGLQDDQTALVENQGEILKLPHGQELFNTLKASIGKTHVTAVVKQDRKVMFGLRTQNQYTAIINIRIKPETNADILKAEIYGNIWKVLGIIDDLKNDRTDKFTQKDTCAYPNWSEEEAAIRNMLADIFAGSVLELKGQKGAMRLIAKERCKSTFEDFQDHEARQNPFPIMLENAQMVFEDISQSAQTDNSPLKTALRITSETIESMDENTVRQWQSFIEPALEMVWGGISIAQILGAAIYTCDNVYNRAAAYMVADILNTDPAPAIQFEGYNAFADTESQQRSHKLACLETFEYLQTYQFEKQNPDPFVETAQSLCNTLLSGKPNGFCAPALIALAQHIIKTPEVSREELSGIFSAEINTLTWHKIRDIHIALISKRSQGEEVNICTIIEFLDQNEETRESAILLKALSDMQATQ